MTPLDQLARIQQDATALRELLSRIKESPELCSRFLRACATIRSLEKEVRIAALKFLEAGQPIPDVELNAGRLSSVVTAQVILELCSDPDLKRRLAKLEAFVAVACPVREAIYLSFCRRLGIKPHSNHVQRNRGQPFVIFKGATGWRWPAGRQL
jgi:hypothetical protein